MYKVCYVNYCMVKLINIRFLKKFFLNLMFCYRFIDYKSLCNMNIEEVGCVEKIFR